MSETLFAKIVAGQLPCHRVWQCPHTLAFLDVAPLSPGHTLLVPRRAVAHLADLTDEEAAALGRALPRLCRALTAFSGCRDINVLQNNGAAAHQTVMHVHFHLIPKPHPDAGLQLSWSTQPLAAAQAASIAAAVSQLAAIDSSVSSGRGPKRIGGPQ